MRINPIIFNADNTFLKRNRNISTACQPIKEVITNKKVAQILSGNYKINNTQPISFGCSHTIIKRNADELILKITDKAMQAASIQIQALIKPADEIATNERIFSVAKRGSDGIFGINLPVINEKTNELLKSVKLLKATFFNANGDIIKTHELNENISPLKRIAKKIAGSFVINTKTVKGGFTPVACAEKTGILKTFDDYDELINYRKKDPIIALLTPNALNELLFSLCGNEDFLIPSKVVGTIANIGNVDLRAGNQMFLSCLSHAKCRLEGKQGLVLAMGDIVKEITSQFKEGDIAKLNIGIKDIQMTKCKSLPASKDIVTLDSIKMIKGLLTPADKGFTPDAVGIKAFNLGELQKMSEGGADFHVPKFFVIPSGEIKQIQDLNPLICDRAGNTIYEKALLELDNAYKSGKSIDEPLEAMRSLIKNDIQLPEHFKADFRGKIQQMFGNLTDHTNIQNEMSLVKDNDIVLSVRSSFPNLEDLDKIASQGMFSSVGGVRAWDEVFPAIKKVWASKWSDIAYRGRMEHSIPHEAVQPAIIVQDFVKDIDYIMTGYTRQIANPDKMLIDLSQGVTSTMSGSPYLFEVNRSTGEIERILMATKGRKKLIENVNLLDKRNGNYQECNYANDVLNKAKEEYTPVIKKIANALLTVENHFDGKAQDIEGGIKFIRDAQGDIQDVKITLWQTRNVQMPKQ